MLWMRTGEVFRFDFAIPFSPSDRLLIGDVDVGEVFQIEAFVRTGSDYSQVSTANWTVEPCTGMMDRLPDSAWPTWDGVAGSFTAASGNNNNCELDILTPDQPIDRLILWQASSNGSGTFNAMQLLAPFSVPESSTWSMLAGGMGSLLMFRRRR